MSTFDHFLLWFNLMINFAHFHTFKVEMGVLWSYTDSQYTNWMKEKLVLIWNNKSYVPKLSFVMMTQFK